MFGVSAFEVRTGVLISWSGYFTASSSLSLPCPVLLDVGLTSSQAKVRLSCWRYTSQSSSYPFSPSFSAGMMARSVSILLPGPAKMVTDCSIFSSAGRWCWLSVVPAPCAARSVNLWLAVIHVQWYRRARYNWNVCLKYFHCDILFSFRRTTYQNSELVSYRFISVGFSFWKELKDVAIPGCKVILIVDLAY